MESKNRIAFSIIKINKNLKLQVDVNLQPTDAS